MNSASRPVENEQSSLPALLAALVIDYVRWLVLVPMVFAWAFLVLVVVLMLAINFQGDIDRMLDRAEPWVERWLGPAEPVGEDEQNMEAVETITLTEQDFKPWVYRIWMFSALAGYLLGLLRSWLFGPWHPPPLKRKLARVAVAAGLCSALLFFAWLFGSEAYAGSAMGWVAMFIFFPLLVWVVSAASLGFSHLLDEIRPIVMKLADRATVAVMRQATRS
jgi:hypothetical protein